MNDVLVRARDLIGRPVVTLDGDQVGEVKDVLLGLRSAALVGFTLRNTGFLGGPRHEAVPWESVHAIGADALMIPAGAVVPDDAVGTSGDGNTHVAVDLPVVTESGDELGRIVDVVLSTGSPSQIVGFEIEASSGMASEGRHMLLPIDTMTSASAEAVVVPASATHFIRDDLAGFGAAIEGFRGTVEEGTDHAGA